MLVNAPTSVTIWFTTAPYQGSVMATEKEVKLNNFAPASIQSAVIKVYKTFPDLPNAPLQFGVRANSDVVLQGVIQNGKILEIA